MKLLHPNDFFSEIKRNTQGEVEIDTFRLTKAEIANMNVLHSSLLYKTSAREIWRGESDRPGIYRAGEEEKAEINDRRPPAIAILTEAT